MQELFRIEAENQTALLTQCLLALEKNPADAAQLESLMRAAHSLKGAARIADIPPAVKVAHAMEDCFVAAQRGEIKITAAETDVLLRCVDLFFVIARQADSQSNPETERQIETLLAELAALREQTTQELPASLPIEGGVPARQTETSVAEPDGVLRLTAENMNRLVGLAGESLVESRRLQPFSDSMQRV